VSLISVVIPTLNDEAYLVRTLTTLVPAVVDGLVKDVIIVDGGSEDSTLEIAESTGCTIISTDANRGLQLWQGCREAKGEWLLILHPDSQLSEGWMDHVRTHMSTHPLRAGYFKLNFDDPSWFSSLWSELVAFNARWLAMPSGDHGLFLSRALYESVGGYKDQVAFEDLSIDLALGRSRLKPISAALTTDGTRFRRSSWYFSLGGKFFSLILYLLGFPQKPKLKPKAQ
jgi:glycosyltransferase involved in cell wall biosynthesis